MSESIYKNKETKDLLMQLYDEKLASLNIHYQEIGSAINVRLAQDCNARKNT